VIAARLFASRGDALATAQVRPGNPLTERAVNFIVKEAAERAVAGRPVVDGVRRMSVAQPMDRGSGIDAMAMPGLGESSGRYLKTKF
jgi:hypothetical protein